MRYRVTHKTRYTYSESVPLCLNQVHLVPRSSPRQTCRWHDLSIKPPPAYRVSRFDAFGNPVCHFSLEEAHRGLTVTSRFEVAITPLGDLDLSTTIPWDQLVTQLQARRDAEWLDAWQHVFCSPAITWTDTIRDYAKVSFPAGRPIGEAVRDLTKRIYTDFKYDTTATTVDSTVEFAFNARKGVCQDFGHLGIAMLRSLGLPARYVSGYLRTIPPPGKPKLVGVDQSHAWFAAFCGDHGWIDYDPTNNVLCDTDHITLAWGRDYGDVCPIQGVFVGGGQHGMTVDVDVMELEAPAQRQSQVQTIAPAG